MEWLETIFDEMPAMLRMFWYIALPISLIFIVQFVMAIAGIGDSSDFDTDLDTEFDSESADALSSTFDPFTIKNLINFLLGFGWGGISFHSVFGSGILTIIAAAASGIVFVLAFFYILKMIHKLSEDNSFSVTKSIDSQGEVYLSIPPEMNGTGKVLVNVNGSMKELKAKTVFEKLTPGTKIKVIGIEDDGCVIVEPLNLIK
ncbi:MAG: hypothetical protein Kapaf2KO_00240 [Candidatus Kapaibacteriales bacterium]